MLRMAKQSKIIRKNNMTKNKRTNDPHYQREAGKYAKPIPSREYILQTLDAFKRPATRAQLAKHFELEGPEDLEALRRRLRAMERDGQLFFNRRGGYCIVSQMDLIRGQVIGHRDGFGFVVPEDGSDDLYLAARPMRALFHGDEVLVSVAGVDRKGRREGNLIKVLQHNTTQLAGRFFLENGVGYVVPNNKHIPHDVLISESAQAEAKHGQMVVVTITEQPSLHRAPQGKISEVLGDHMAPGMEVDVALRTYNIPCVWPPEVSQQAETFAPQVDPTAIEGRKDLRDLPLVTIDGIDAKDFDDAVYCESKSRGGWRLIVAIADVAHYVEPGSALDKEAQLRGNSVYFSNKVVPMLPEVLSNGLCSLRPDEDRLCIACEMSISRDGKISRYHFYEAVIRSHARLTYSEVAKVLVQDDAELKARYATLLPQLHELYALYNVLIKHRATRGAIDFEFTQTRIVFDSKGKIEAIVPTERNDAHRIIEECMLAANVSAAKFLLKNKVPTLFRVHDGPSPDKLDDLREFLKGLGLSLRGGKKPKPADYAKVLTSISGRDDAHLIQMVLLRSLGQAVYGPENEGHFGLAYDAYGHFTSPIRRYPDLLVHRAIRHILQRGSAESFAYDEKAMLRLGEQCSMTERRADDASRDVQDWLKCEFMLNKVGDEFNGIITSVVSFGLFVELEEVYVDGLVHITSLESDYYRFDPIKHRLTGKNTGVQFCLGDTVRVRVVRVDLDDKQLDLELIQNITMKK